jgi:hypothetical protein
LRVSVNQKVLNPQTLEEANIRDFEILSGCLVNTKGGLAAKWAMLGERSRPQALPYRQFGARMGSLCPPSSWTVSQTLIEAVYGWLTAIQAIQFSASDSGESFGTVRRDPGAANLPAFSVGRRMLAEIATLVTARNLAALAPEADRKQVRRQCESKARPAGDSQGNRGAGRPDGLRPRCNDSERKQFIQ